MTNTEWILDIENIAGIRSGQTTLQPGINTVEAGNWQGKSSLIAALKTVMGTATPLQDGAENGYVRLTTPDETYEVHLTRNGGTVVSTDESTPFLEDPVAQEIARLFAFFDETNPVREAVRQGDNLEDLLLAPLNLEDLQQQIADLDRERQQIEYEIDQVQDTQRRLTSVEQELAEKRRTLEELKQQRDGLDIDSSAEEVERKRTTLSDKKSKRNRLERDIETTEERIESIKDQLEETKAELEALEIPNEPDRDTATAELEDERKTLERQIDLLQDLYRVNKRIIDEDQGDLVTTVDRQLTDIQMDCWICGSETDKATVESQLEELNEAITDRKRQVNGITERIQQYEEEQRKREQQRRRKQELERNVSDLRERLESKQSSQANYRQSLTEIDEEIEVLEEEVGETHRELVELESEIKTTENEIETLESQVEDLESQIDQHQHLEEQLTEIKDELEQLRGREDRKKQEVHDRFETALEDIIGLFDPGFGGGHLSNFEITIARDGRATSIDSLSEGERELLAVITALAGFETFDVDVITPLLLIDSIGMLSPSNLDTLMNYLSNHSEFLVTTAYPEQVEFTSHVIDPQQWDIVSEEAVI